MGQAIVLAALDIVHRREERHRNEKKRGKKAEIIKRKEKETEEWNKDISKQIKCQEDSDQMNRQEEWNTNISDQIKR